MDAYRQAFKIGPAQIDCFPNKVVDPASDAVAVVEADQRAQTSYDRRGALDLRDCLCGDLCDGTGVRVASANGVIDQPRIGAGRHQGLVQFMRHRRGKLSRATESREPSERFLMQAQFTLGTAALRHKLSSKESRQSEHQHERLDLRHFRDFMWESMKA